RPRMNPVELDQALRKLRLSGMADVLETRLRQAQSDKMAPLDLVSALVSDELLRRQDRLFARRHKLARFRDPDRSLDSFDFDFNKKMNRALAYELATARFVAQREDALFLGPPGTGKSHLAQALGRSATPTSSSAAHEAGAPRLTPTCATTPPRDRWAVEAAGAVDVQTDARPQAPWTPANGRRRPQLPQPALPGSVQRKQEGYTLKP